jgi:hypothetical protein
MEMSGKLHASAALPRGSYRDSNPELSFGQPVSSSYIDCATAFVKE